MRSIAPVLSLVLGVAGLFAVVVLNRSHGGSGAWLLGFVIGVGVLGVILGLVAVIRTRTWGRLAGAAAVALNLIVAASGALLWVLEGSGSAFA